MIYPFALGFAVKQCCFLVRLRVEANTAKYLMM